MTAPVLLMAFPRLSNHSPRLLIFFLGLYIKVFSLLMVAPGLLMHFPGLLMAFPCLSNHFPRLLMLPCHWLMLLNDLWLGDFRE